MGRAPVERFVSKVSPAPVVEKLTCHATESTQALDVGSGQRASCAGNSALALAVLEGTGTSGSTTGASDRTSRSSGASCGSSGGSRCSSGSTVASSGSSTSSNGSSGASAVLGDGHGLEHGLGLGGGGVDREGHALSTVALLLAVEPYFEFDG